MTTGLAKNKRLGFQQSSHWAPCVSRDTSGNRKEKSGNGTQPLCARFTKAYFCSDEILPGSARPDGGSAWSSESCLQRDPLWNSPGRLGSLREIIMTTCPDDLGVEQACSLCSRTQRPEKYIIVLGESSSLTNPEDALSRCEHYLRLLGHHFI